MAGKDGGPVIGLRTYRSDDDDALNALQHNSSMEHAFGRYVWWKNHLIEFAHV